MQYIKDNDGTPESYSIRQLREDNPETSFPKTFPAEVLARFGIYEVAPVALPPYDTRTEGVVETDPVEVAPGVWEQRWVVEPLAPEDIERVNRNVAQQERISMLKSDGGAAALLGMTPGEIDTYCDTQLINVQDLKEVVRVLLKAVAVSAAATFD